MGHSVYIETTIVSYLTAWPSRDIIRLTHEVTTRDWWRDARPRFDLYTSEIVRYEAAAGDPEAARLRLAALGGIPLLPLTPDVEPLAERIASDLALPQRALPDALHVALAAVHGISFLLTWNCKHLANGILLPKIDRACLIEG